MILVAPDMSSHWYGKNGKPQYYVDSTGDSHRKRKATLRDARKNNWVPSVTTILNILRKPQLEAWKIEQAILATLTLPRVSDETETTYMKRIVDDATSASRRAATLGSAVHDCIERYYQTEVIDTAAYLEFQPDLDPIMKGWLKWWEGKQVEQSERPFACKDGFGGKVDLIYQEDDSSTGPLILADYKTQSTKKGHRTRSYVEHGLQLSAYWHGIRMPYTGEFSPNQRFWLDRIKRTQTIIISTTEPGRIETVDWTAKNQELYEVFLKLLGIWSYLKNYYPNEEKEQ